MLTLVHSGSLLPVLGQHQKSFYGKAVVAFFTDSPGGKGYNHTCLRSYDTNVCYADMTGTDIRVRLTGYWSATTSKHVWAYIVQTVGLDVAQNVIKQSKAKSFKQFQEKVKAFTVDKLRGTILSIEYNK